jgi:hypothetical protein
MTREAKGNEPRSKERVQGTKSFTNPVEGLVAFIYKASAGGRWCMVALKLLYIDIGDNTRILKCNDHVHLLNLEIMETSKSEENTKGGIPNGGG